MIERGGKLGMWVIYDRPTDYPSAVIARLHILDQPQKDIVIGESIEEVRACLLALDPNLFCLHRDPQDPLSIVEVWL